MQFLKGSGYKGVAFGDRLYVGWQHNLPLWRILLRFARCGGGVRQHIWLGPVYVQVG